MGERLPLIITHNEKSSMPMEQQHKVDSRRTSSDWASAKEERCRFSLEGGVVVAVLS
jgi:hypothetical protein